MLRLAELLLGEIQWFQASEQQQAEIVNCVISERLGVALGAGKLGFRKFRVVGHFEITSGQEITIEDCIVRNPTGSAFLIKVPFGEGKSVPMSARNTLFLARGSLSARGGGELSRWSGTRNGYAVAYSSAPAWQLLPEGLADWQRTSASDADAIAGIRAPEYDPQQWRWPNGSPVRRLTPEGKAIGAEVTRVAIVRSR